MPLSAQSNGHVAGCHFVKTQPAPAGYRSVR
jgi:hypothetical protein